MTEFFQLHQPNPIPIARYKHTLISCTHPTNLIPNSSSSPCLLLFGGANDIGEPLESCHRFDLDEEKWSVISQGNQKNGCDQMPEPVMSHCAVYIPSNSAESDSSSDCILIFGGLNQNHEYTNLLWKFQNYKWSDITLQLNSTLMPSERMSHAMVYQKNTRRVILFGGKTNIGVSNELWFFSLERNQWMHAITRESDVWPSQRCAHTLVLWRERYLVLYGGTNENVMLDDLWIFDLDTQQWEQMTFTGQAPPRGLSASNHSSCICEDFMFSWVNDTLYALDLLSFMWTKIGAMSHSSSLSATSSIHKRVIPEERIGTTLTILGNDLFMWGGFRNSGALSDLYMLPLSHVSILKQTTKFLDEKFAPAQQEAMPTENTVNSLSSIHQSQEDDNLGETIFPIVSLNKKPDFASPSNFIEDGDEYHASDQQPKTQSLLARHLTDERWYTLRGLSTPSNHFFLDVIINSGVQNPDSKIGVYAPDAEAYTTFQDLFNPIIADYHDGYQVDSELFDSDFNVHNFHGDNPDPEHKYIMSTEIRLRRNFSNVPFPPGVNRAQRRLIYDQVQQVIQMAQRRDPHSIWKGAIYDFITMNDSLRLQLNRDGLLFERDDRIMASAGIYRDWPDARAIFLSVDKRLAACINCEDSLQLICKRKDGNIRACFQRIVEAISSLEGDLLFAKDVRRGFLTSCPAHLGTGLTASVVLRIRYANKQSNFELWCKSRHIWVEPVDEQHEILFRISNRCTLGMTEVRSIQALYDGVIALISWEEDLQYDMEQREMQEQTSAQPVVTSPEVLEKAKPLDFDDSIEQPSIERAEYAPPTSVRTNPDAVNNFEDDYVPEMRRTPYSSARDSFTDTPDVRHLERELRKNIHSVTSSKASGFTQISSVAAKTSKSPFELAAFYELCCKMHEVVPNSLVVKQLKNGSFCENGTIDLSDNVVGDAGLKPVAELIPEFGPYVHALDFSFNGIRNTGVEFLCNVLVTHDTKVNKLNLSKNMISLSGADALIKLVSNNKNIVNVNLNGTKVDIQHKLRINRVMEQNRLSKG
mmetsp:Transcript_11489/g.43122  ORF Transcript_11489/g.43122 Transcript_11489/m.43122 type:complete len:1040 (-) Transcript_11489:21-3140(-)